MKRTIDLLCLFFLLSPLAKADCWIRVNQIGYLPPSPKVAVLISEEPVDVKRFELVEPTTGKRVHTFRTIHKVAGYGKMTACYRLDFSGFQRQGEYQVKVGKTLSPRIRISSHAYDGTADFLLNYMRQQRCGFNPFIGDSCHTHDGYIVYHPTLSGHKIDARGGWHDATDQLQYATTSANATYQMLFAYEQSPSSFADHYDASGTKGSNGIPDILDEAKWGLDWLCRMNPVPNEYYNQIADDRDHVGTRLPSNDKADYGYGPGQGRPVYYCSGEPQRRGKFMNQTTGVASTVGKFSSCFSLGSRLLEPYYPEFARQIRLRAQDAYQTARRKPGVCQTASVLSPYIYEEDNWTDDMELAAIELYRTNPQDSLLVQAVEYGRREPITPWMGADSARHYQWYPFMNMGHVRLAELNMQNISREFLRNLRSGIERTYQKAQSSAFLNGIPYIWCSNNLCTAMLTQCRLYRQLSGDNTYREMEASLLDWLFGCNPWGTSMVADLPADGIHPTQPHAIFPRFDMGNATGGLVDGPVYTTIFNSLIGISLKGLPGKPGQAYERFQPDRMVYHDATGDYSTNEPTMDGTASLTYYLSSLQKEGQVEKP